jgi:hypothetical protein
VRTFLFLGLNAMYPSFHLLRASQLLDLDESIIVWRWSTKSDGRAAFVTFIYTRTLKNRSETHTLDHADHNFTTHLDEIEKVI